jgi:hypothetical protein
MKTNLFVLLLFIAATIKTQSAFAQKNEAIETSQISFSPFRIIDPLNPGLELGFEKVYNKRFSTLLSIGYMKDLFHVTPFNNYKGWRSAVEERYYFPIQKRRRIYLAIDAVYLKANYGYRAWLKHDEVLTPDGYYDPFDVSMKNLSFNCKYGIQLPLKHFVFDFSTGIGLKYRSVERTGFNDAGDKESMFRHFNFYYNVTKDGHGLRLNVPVNLRIGYSF